MPRITCTWSVALLVAICCGLPPAASAQERAADASWSSLRVPGGTSALMSAAGLDPATPRAQVLWTLIRSLHAFPAGLESAADRRRAAVFTYLQTVGELEGLQLPDESVPSPLPESAWTALLKPAPPAPGTTVAAILKDRRASLLFVGLAATDRTTRAYLGANPVLLDTIYRTSRVAALAAHGQSLHVREERVDVPGGADAVPLWEDLIGEPVTRPDRFILELLDKDNGKAAILYSAIARLDGTGRAFVLGRRLQDPAKRIPRFRALYAASLTAQITGNPVDHPFSQPLYDAAHVLSMLRYGRDGHPVPPTWRRLWDLALASEEIPAAPSDEVQYIEQDGLLDAADIIERICVANARVRRERAEMWLFAQRVFADPPTSEMPFVLVTLRGYQRFGALVLTLERLGITDPFVYAKALTRAQQVMSIGGTQAAANALALFQGSLALIERARHGHAIDAESAGRLVVSLSTLPLADDGASAGSVARWIALVFLSALKPQIVPLDARSENRTLEQSAIRAFAGLSRAPGLDAPRVVDIEGLKYRVDPAAADAARWSAVRAAQGGVTLDQALAFARAAEKLADSVPDISVLAPRLSAVVESSKPLVAHEPRAQTAAGVPPRLSRLITDTTARVARMKTPADTKALTEISQRLLRAADYFLAEVLVAMAYAPHVGDAAGKAMLAGDPSPRHDWGLTERFENDRLRGPWKLPVEARDASGVWRVTGSVLALDVGLGDLALRRVFTESLPDPPTVNPNEREAFTEGVSLGNALDYLDADRDTLADAIQRGRDQVASLVSNPGALADLLDGAGIRDARREMIGWTLTNEPTRLMDFFALGDLLRIGRVATSPVAELDAWGTSGLAREGCLCLMFPRTGDWEALAGRRDKAVVAALMPDLALMVAESLRQRQLPASLTRGVLAAATQDFLDDVRMAFNDDWISMFRQVRKTLPPRMDDYIASLTTRGPLVPVR